MNCQGWPAKRQSGSLKERPTPSIFSSHRRGLIRRPMQDNAEFIAQTMGRRET